MSQLFESNDFSIYKTHLSDLNKVILDQESINEYNPFLLQKYKDYLSDISGYMYLDNNLQFVCCFCINDNILKDVYVIDDYKNNDLEKQMIKIAIDVFKVKSIIQSNDDKELINIIESNNYLLDKNTINNYEKLYITEYINRAAINMKQKIELKMDNDGNILIQKQENADLMNIYQRSKELLKEYYKVKNYNGIKYELCKLYMMIIIIDNKILYRKGIMKKFISKSKIEYGNKCKMFAMNSFKHYLRKILEIEKDFNFQEYFNQTQFGIAVYKIDPNIISGLLKIIL